MGRIPGSFSLPPLKSVRVGVGWGEQGGDRLELSFLRWARGEGWHLAATHGLCAWQQSFQVAVTRCGEHSTILPLLLVFPLPHFLLLVILSSSSHPFHSFVFSLPLILLTFPISSLYFICKNTLSVTSPFPSSRQFLLALPFQGCSADKPAYPRSAAPSLLMYVHQCLSFGSGDTDHTAPCHPDAVPQAFCLSNEGCGQI